jgi:hypothetical protein
MLDFNDLALARGEFHFFGYPHIEDLKDERLHSRGIRLGEYRNRFPLGIAKRL